VSYFQAVVIGLLQGVTELFPVSSLGHSVVVPGLFGWHNIVDAQSKSESFYLAFLVGLHVATALALLWYFRDEWVRIIGGFFRSLGRMLKSGVRDSVQTKDERLAWLLVIATIPAGIMGLLLEHALRVLLATPVAASILLAVNGLILAFGERVRRRQQVHTLAVAHGVNEEGARRLDTLEYRESGLIGVSQVFALMAGISRSGITMVAGLVRGLDHEDAARFSFLLATPIILAAGVYKLPDLLGSNGAHIRGQVVVGSICAGLTAYLAVRFLMRFFETRNLNPFAGYCLLVGITTAIYFAFTW
jgi:undecaprenyl-diphosphatase